MSLQDPVLDAALHPLGPVLCRDAALQLRRQGLGVPADVLEQVGVPNPVEIVGPPKRAEVSSCSTPTSTMRRPHFNFRQVELCWQMRYTTNR